MAALQMRANEMHERAMALAQKRLRKLDKEHKRAMRESDERLKNLDHEKAMAESDERLGQLDEEREFDRSLRPLLLLLLVCTAQMTDRGHVDRLQINER